MRASAWLIVPLLVLSAACAGPILASAPSPAPTVTVTSTVTASPEPTEEPEEHDLIQPTSVKDLREQLEILGLNCEDYDETIKKVAASCDDLILLGYSDGSEKQDNLMQASIALGWQAVRTQDREDEIAYLVGDNWFGRFALEDANTLHDDLKSGGVILH